jgi:aryl-alcohol dehydrogenase-like predicted oxidoreductase
MNRRQFFVAMGSGLVTAPVLAKSDSTALPKRTLGRTGIRVPIIGFGGGSRFLMFQDEDRAIEVLHHALNLGIVYLDTAHAYGNGKSEERIGHVMAIRRGEVVLATKVPGRKADQARRQIELSLKRLQTDHLDVLHIHDLKDEADLAAIEAPGGVLEALYQARDQKVTRAIGITCHANPAVLKTALERHDFDCTQMALNAGLARMADSPGGMKAAAMGKASFEALALPVAERKHLGVIAMKVFGQEQLLGTAPVDKLLAYVLSLPVSLASIGMPRWDLLEQNMHLARDAKPMSPRQRRSLADSIDLKRQAALQHFLSGHVDV